MRVRFSFSSRRTGKIENMRKKRKPVPAIVKEIIGISDIVLEIVDARFIEKTRNKDIESFVHEMGKKLIFVINKADLVDVVELKRTIDLEELKPYVLFSCKTNMGRGDLRTLIKIESKRLKQARKTHVGIIGYPNTGKSSIINLLAGRNAARTASEAGFTRGLQKIRLAKGILLLDTPGVMPEKEAPAHKAEHVKKLSIIGVQTYDKVKNPEFVVSELMRLNRGVFEKFYGIEADGDAEKLLDGLGKKYNFLARGGIVDTDRTARMVLKDWQTGKIKKS